MRIYTFSFAAACILVFLAAGPLSAQEEAWQTLFNGKDFSGWKKLNGQAEYRIENGEIVGVARQNTPNTFLATERDYGDFILEVDVKVDPRLNSGIQFRSLSRPDYQDGRVHGYQAEIDPSPRAYSGGIYDEARRGWLYPLSLNPMGQTGFKPGDWNAYRIEAIGNDIRIWINGVQTALLADDMTPEGFIALQVHSIGDPSLEGAEVRWRNIRLLTGGLEKARRAPHPGVAVENLVPNSLTEQERRQGWRLLWDGKTSEGWRSARSEEFPARGWEMKDGVLTVLESGGEEAAAGGDIITRDEFGDFELKLEFMITEGANSGIKYFVDPELNQREGSAIGLEYQILDDDSHPDAKMGVAGNRTLASLYDLLPARNLSTSSRGVEFRGVGKWNQARIVARSNHVEHWLNGFKVVEFERRTPMFQALVAYSKYKIWPGFGDWSKGHLLLQDHGNRVSFRSIKVREF